MVTTITQDFAKGEVFVVLDFVLAFGLVLGLAVDLPPPSPLTLSLVAYLGRLDYFVSVATF